MVHLQNQSVDLPLDLELLQRRPTGPERKRQDWEVARQQLEEGEGLLSWKGSWHA